MITITEEASKEIKKQAKASDNHPSLRVAIRGGGCSGFSYVFEWGKNNPDPKDQIFTLDGAFVFVDPKSLVYLAGSELDFETSFMGRGFKLNNPNAKSSCGCGESVQF